MGHRLKGSTGVTLKMDAAMGVTEMCQWRSGWCGNTRKGLSRRSLEARTETNMKVRYPLNGRNPLLWVVESPRSECESLSAFMRRADFHRIFPLWVAVGAVAGSTVAAERKDGLVLGKA
jgi:hypothetical protein